MNSAFKLLIDLLMAVFGPFATAKLLAQAQMAINDIKEPVLRAELDEQYNKILESREGFKSDRDENASE